MKSLTTSSISLFQLFRRSSTQSNIHVKPRQKQESNPHEFITERGAGQQLTNPENALAADWQRALCQRLALSDGNCQQTADLVRLISLWDSLPSSIRRSLLIAFEAAAISLLREQRDRTENGD